MRLQRLFLTLSILLSITVSLIAAGTLGNAWHQLSRARDGMLALEQLQAMLVTYEMVSRERGPANTMLGNAQPADQYTRQKLTQARQSTDDAFELLLLRLGDSQKQLHATVSEARHRLEQARAAVDHEADKQREQRNAPLIRNAVNQMIDVINNLSPALLGLTNQVSASFPATTDALLAAVQAAALREYAGQLGSQLTATLATRQPLKIDELKTINRLRGRIEQLREQLKSRATTLEHNLPVRSAIAIMGERYFDSAIPFVEEQIETGLRDGNYQVDTALFAARYVPDMNSIVSLRDILMNDAIAAARSKQKQTTLSAIKSIAGSSLLFVLLGLTWWLLHRRVVLPLTRTTELIVTIANGQLDIKIPASKYRDEVADMLAAIAVLRDNSIARYEAEKAVRQLAFHDPLTGLPNRRLLDDRLQQSLLRAHRNNSVGAVLFIDLDRFKQVNDERGHETGDWLLKQAAGRMCSMLRESDTVARIGGDEFIILLPDIITMHNASRIAEKVRQQMDLPFVMEDGSELRISSSIGVVLFPVQADNLEELLRYGDAAMYAAKRQGRNGIMAYSRMLIDQ